MIAIGGSVVIDCESCMKWHIKQALGDGATEYEIIESIKVGIEMSGGPETASAVFAMYVLEYYQQKKMIRQVTIQDDFDQLAKLLNESYLTVIDDFGITKENCPFHNAFISGDTLKSKLISIREFYCLEKNN